MAKGYWIAQVDVSDEGRHAAYAKAAVEFLKRRGAKTLVVSPRQGRYEIVEGGPRSRRLIQEFPDYDTALAAYHSEEYQMIRKLRQNTAIVDLVIVEGIDTPFQDQDP